MEHSLEKIDCSILYAEDEESIRKSISRVLRLKFTNVYCVEDGAEALEIFKNNKIDIVISDIMMPKMNGLELAREIKKQSPDIPVMFITAYNETNFFIEAIECGASKFLIKPIDLSKFLNALYEVYETIKIKKELAKQKTLLEGYKKAVDVSNIVSKTDINGIITYVNDEFCRISGYTKEELIGKNQNIVRHPNMDKEVFTTLWNTILSKKVWKGIIENRAKNGSSYWVDATIVPIVDENGGIIEFIGIRKDITDLILHEKELERLRAKEAKESVDKALALNLKKTIELTPLAAVVIDSSDKILYANKKFVQLFDPILDSHKLEAIEKQTLYLSDIFLREGLFSDYDSADAISWRDMIKDLDIDIDTITLLTCKSTYEMKVRLFEVKDENSLYYILYFI